MRLSHRSLLTALLLTIFLIVLLGKIDGKSSWNWFSIFAPIWVIDVVHFVLLRYTNQRSEISTDDDAIDSKRKNLMILSLKMLFQLLLCIKLEWFDFIPLFVVMMPLWAFMIIISINILRALIIDSED
ncbi:type I inositol 3 4-bisphosphate 4-phosphatase-like [Sarcoptes scabiei]|nr:type I inositol 3 4-bisphosphate 4-phosphatase-like [Sarcoptes scabiei]